jgi:hypothetical protein
MLYLDYNFDLSDNMIIFDKELKLKTQVKDNPWGSLPDVWKENDTFRLVVGANGSVVLLRENK